MKTYIILIIALLTLPFTSQAYDLYVEGYVNDIETGNPVSNQDMVIMIDSTSSGGFSYYNYVTTDNFGFYSDLIIIPTDMSGVVGVGTFGCGILYEQTEMYTPNSNTLYFDFEICTDPSGGNCQAYFEYYPDTDPLSIQFLDYSSGWPTSWSWDFGDGTTSYEQSPLHYYLEEGDYYTSLIIEGDSCYSEFSMYVHVENDTIGDCEAYYQYASGIEPLSIEFDDMSIGNVIRWVWDFGDGDMSLDQNPVHTYDYEGEYNVSLFIETDNSCFSYFEDFVWVENDTTYCNAGFNVMLDTLNNVPHTYVFTDQSEGDIVSWFWDFGDGNFSFEQNPIHIYSDGGEYDVCLTVTTVDGGSMCESTECNMVSTLEYYSFGGQAFIGNYPINIDSADDANIALAYLYLKIDHRWEYMDQREFWQYGYYWFADKPVGEYLIQTELTENSLEYFNYAPGYHMDAISWNNASTFILSNGQQFDINISFKELATYSSGIGTISGLIISGQSCDTMQNINTDHVLIQLFNNSEELIDYTYSDVDGYYEFTGLGEGNYNVRAEYTGRYSEERIVSISNTNPNVNDIELTVHCSHILGVNETITDNQFQVGLPYPAPSNDFVNVKISSIQNTSGNISIINLIGNIVYSAPINIVEGNQNIVTSVSSLPPGLYSMRISMDNSKYHKNYKIIIIH